MPGFLRGTFRRRPAVEKITLALRPEMAEPLDRFRARQGGISRAEAIQILLRDGLLQLDLAPMEGESSHVAAGDREDRAAA